MEDKTGSPVLSAGADHKRETAFNTDAAGVVSNRRSRKAHVRWEKSGRFV